MTRQEYKCWLKLDRLLKAMHWRGFPHAETKAWYSEWILNASALAAVGDWDQVLVVLHDVEEAYYEEWAYLQQNEGRKAA